MTLAPSLAADTSTGNRQPATGNRQPASDSLAWFSVWAAFRLHARSKAQGTSTVWSPHFPKRGFHRIGTLGLASPNLRSASGTVKHPGQARFSRLYARTCPSQRLFTRR